jgi:hypothetical protein
MGCLLSTLLAPLRAGVLVVRLVVQGFCVLVAETVEDRRADRLPGPGRDPGEPAVLNRDLLSS